MLEKPETNIIESISEDGNTFKSVNWRDLLEKALAGFTDEQRLKHGKNIHICTINGINYLIIDPDLKIKTPETFTFLINFAAEHNLIVQEDRRQKQQNISADRRTDQVYL